MKSPMLSILICSLMQRKELLLRLLGLFDLQKNPCVEILIEVDDGTMTVGEKRGLLLNKARGEYVAFVDDDDLVSNNYVEKILAAIKDKPDCCGMEGLIRFERKRVVKKFVHSIQYDHWFEMNGIYCRCPNHLSPVKREYALQTGFKPIMRGEDRDYSMRLLPLLKTEVYITGPIYFYLTG